MKFGQQLLKFENLVDNQIFNNEDKLRDYRDLKKVLESLSEVITQVLNSD